MWCLILSRIFNWNFEIIVTRPLKALNQEKTKKKTELCCQLNYNENKEKCARPLKIYLKYVQRGNETKYENEEKRNL